MRRLPRRRAALALWLPAAALLAGCGVTATGPERAGPPAEGRRVEVRAHVFRVYFLTSRGIWPVARTAPEDAGPQGALDALLAGPTPSEHARGLLTALPPGTHRVKARASRGAVDLYLPWLVSELDRTAVSQLVCTAAAAPGIPGSAKVPDVVVRIHESGLPGEVWPVLCDGSGAAAPLNTGGRAR
ncbi:GerMN domain-containing protein [Streptomyces montanisoli]|uniref:GerMN domain-containing protein n=1 Tax=Streptomyces montanisoli TaxID=2798581 RepID=A0A940MA63_9ACTN|nr:GerMN domain-containing protein [Streptomyces montanisoli]MBP0456716.1 GerMN domain-containing protein [Streptomyces montanisoli]